MKKLYLAILTTAGTLAGNLQADLPICIAANVPNQERQILERNCWEIRSRIAERFAGYGALSSSGFSNTVKYEITRYLQSVRTQAALSLLNELQSNGFKDYI